jgi:hypothetical protein
MERKKAFIAVRSCVALVILLSCCTLSPQKVEDPQGVPQDYVEAANWFRKAAEQGYVQAQNRLAQMLAIGQGIQQNDAEAASWYRKAADQGVVPAQGKGSGCGGPPKKGGVREAQTKGLKLLTRLRRRLNQASISSLDHASGAISRFSGTKHVEPIDEVRRFGAAVLHRSVAARTPRNG